MARSDQQVHAFDDWHANRIKLIGSLDLGQNGYRRQALVHAGCFQQSSVKYARSSRARHESINALGLAEPGQFSINLIAYRHLAGAGSVEKLTISPGFRSLMPEWLAAVALGSVVAASMN